MIPYNALSDLPVDNVIASEGNIISYETFVCNLVKKMPSTSEDLNHMIIGIAGEAGEICDAIKKNTIYGKTLDLNNVIEELGDLEWYMAGLRQMLGISRRTVLDANVVKLQARYTGGTYSDQAANDRADKIVSITGAPIMSSNLQVVNMALMNEHVEAADSTAAALTPSKEDVKLDATAMPDWLRTAINNDPGQNKKAVVAWHVHKGIANTLSNEGTQKRYYDPDYAAD